MTALALLLAAGAAPSLYLSVETASGTSSAHLSARGAEEVELTLYALPPDPKLFALYARPLPPAGPPPLLRRAEASRGAVLDAVKTLRAGLSPRARSLAKQFLGLDAPLSAEIAAPAKSLVESAGTLLTAWRLDTPEVGWNYADIDLGHLVPGLYAVAASALGVRTRAVFSVGGLSGLVVHAGGMLAVLAQDSDTGAPRAGTEVFAQRGDEWNALGRTGPDGLLLTKTTAIRLVLAKDHELAALDVPPAVHGGSAEATGVVLLDRRAAPSGETVHLWAVWRSLSAGAPRLALPDSARVEIALRDWEGRMLAWQPATLSGLGTLTAAFELPLGLAPGAYSLSVAAGNERRSAPLEILEPGTVPLQLRCGREAEGIIACTADDGAGHPQAGVAVRWEASGTVARPGHGIAETTAEGSLVTDSRGRATISARFETGRLRAQATDGFGRSVAVEVAFEGAPAPSAQWVVHPERRFSRPGHLATVTVEGVGPEQFHRQVHVLATLVHMSPTGDAQRTPLTDRWLDADARGHAALSLTPGQSGYVEISASGAGGEIPARGTLFVTDVGGDIPATPERLTLVPEVGERRRGEESRLLVLAPFESGAVVLAFDSAIMPPQVVLVHGYSGVARVQLPLGPEPVVAHAYALRANRVVSDRLVLLRSARASLLSARLAADHSHPTRGLEVELDDELGKPMAGQLAAVAIPPGAPEFPSFLDLLEPPGSALGVAAAESSLDSLPHGSPAEISALAPFGPARGPVAVRAPGTFLSVLAVPDTGRASFGTSSAEGSVVGFVTAGPDEVGEARLRLDPPPPLRSGLLVAPVAIRAGDRFEVVLDDEGCRAQLSIGGKPLASSCEGNERRGTVEASGQSLEIAAERDGKVFEHKSVRTWAADAHRSTLLADRIAETLNTPPANGPSADLSCAAVRALGVVKANRLQARGAIARLAQLENLAGGFGESSGELRRDLSALRGLRALGQNGDPDLLMRTRRRIGSLTENMEEDEAGREEALAAVAGGERDTKRRPRDIAAASAVDLALWLSSGRTRRADRPAIVSRVEQLLVGADVLDMAELALAASAVGLSAPAHGLESPAVRRRFARLDAPPWTTAELEADDEPPEPKRVEVAGAFRLGDELEVSLQVPAEGQGVSCVRDFPPASFALAGSAAAGASSGELLLCGLPSAGVLSVGYRARAVAPGIYGAPAPSVGPLASAGTGQRLEVRR